VIGQKAYWAGGGRRIGNPQTDACTRRPAAEERPRLGNIDSQTLALQQRQLGWHGAAASGPPREQRGIAARVRVSQGRQGGPAVQIASTQHGTAHQRAGVWGVIGGRGTRSLKCEQSICRAARSAGGRGAPGKRSLGKTAIRGEAAASYRLLSGSEPGGAASAQRGGGRRAGSAQSAQTNQTRHDGRDDALLRAVEACDEGERGPRAMIARGRWEACVVCGRYAQRITKTGNCRLTQRRRVRRHQWCLRAESQPACHSSRLAGPARRVAEWCPGKRAGEVSCCAFRCFS
jgi:hypothetical protein